MQIIFLLIAKAFYNIISVFQNPQPSPYFSLEQAVQLLSGQGPHTTWAAPAGAKQGEATGLLPHNMRR